MASKVTVSSASAMTPGRSTTLTLDVPETVVIEPGVRLLRTGSDIAARGAEGTSNQQERQNMRFLSSGCWILEPLQYEIANVQEDTTTLSFVIRASDFNFIQTSSGAGTINSFAEFLNWVQSDLQGAGFGGAVPAIGDYFLRKIIPASGSCDPSTVPANATFDAAGPPLVPYPNTDVPMDRAAVSTTIFRANQGFFLRWHVPASPNTYPRYLFTFYFGQYALIVGTSLMWLMEYCQPAGGGAFRWVQRRKLLYGSPGQQAGVAHSLGIFPHRSPSGINYIAFTDISTDKAPQVNTRETLTSKSTVHGETIYTADQSVRQGDIDAAPGLVTAANKVRLDVRRDLRANIQVSTLAFHTSGTLIDDDTHVAGLGWTGNGNTVGITRTSNESANYFIADGVFDGQTSLPFVPGTDHFPQAQFVFTSTDGADTPILWGYTMSQFPLSITATPGEFTVAGKSYQVECAAGDPQTETATISGIVDLAMTHTRLTKRERFSAVLSTTYDPGSGPVNVALLRGVVAGNRSVRKGVGRAPWPDWQEYTLTCAGMWDRLKEYVEPPFYRIYAMDGAAPIGTILTWKVTDALRDLLGACGFPGSQINIPDLPVRFWPGQTQKLEDTTVNPTANLAEFAVRICRDYLGAFLHFEPNAGAAGQWILIFGTQQIGGGAFSPVGAFQASSHGLTAPPTVLGAYPAGTAPYFSIEWTRKRPDANQIEVIATVPAVNANAPMSVRNSAVNPLSFAVPGMSTAPNPDHPDYLGYRKRIQIIADYLYVPGDDGGYAATQAAVNWVTRRLYDFLCHGQRIAKIRAPLVFIQDAAIAGSASGGWRPLRFQDPVMLDGDPSFLVKSVRVEYGNDRAQMATYELIQPFPGQYFFGFDGKEQIRRLRRLGTTMVSGSSSHSSAVGILAPSAHREQGRLTLPMVRGSWSVLQNADGSFIPIDGWNTWNGTAG